MVEALGMIAPRVTGSEKKREALLQGKKKNFRETMDLKTRMVKCNIHC